MTNQITSGAQSSAPSYRETLGHRESSGNYDAVNQLGYLGKYQMGGMTLQDLGYKNAAGEWTGKDGMNSSADFLSSPEVQENAQTRLMNMQDRALNHYGATEFIGQEFAGVQVTPEGLRAAAHLVGPKAVSRMLKSGEVPEDANGTKATEYMAMFAPTQGQAVEPMPLETPPTVGDQKREHLQKRSEEKRLELSGLSQAEQQMLNMDENEYVAQGGLMNAAQRRYEYHQAAAKKTQIQEAQAEAQNTAFFEHLESPENYWGNVALSTANTVGRIIGGLGSIPDSVAASFNLANVTKEDLQTFRTVEAKREQGMELTEADQKFLQSEAYEDIVAGMDDMQDAQKIQDFFGGLQKYVNTELTDEFVESGKASFDKLVSGEANAFEFAGEIGSLIKSSPGALGQASVESIPYVVASMLNLPLTVASSWSNNQMEAIRAHEQETGKLMVGDQLLEATALTFGQSLVDHFGDKVMGGLGTGVAKKGFGVAIGGTVTGAAGEFVAEGGAEVLGQLAAQGDVTGDVDWGQSFGAGLLGAGAGGVTTGTMSAATLLSQDAEGESRTSGLAEGIKKAFQDEDTATVMKRERPKRESRRQRQAAEDTANAAQAAEATGAPVQEEAPQTEEAPQQPQPEQQAQPQPEAQPEPQPQPEPAPKKQRTKTRVEKARGNETSEQMGERVLGNLKRAYDNGDVENIKTVEEEFMDLHATVQEIKAAKPDQSTWNEAEKATAIAFVGIAKERAAMVKAFKEKQGNKNASSNASSLGSLDTYNPQAEVALNNVLGSMEANDGQVSAEQAKAILENKNIPLTEEQKVKFNDHIEVENAKNSIGVGKDVIEGGRGFIGVNQYQQRINDAVAELDFEQAETELAALDRFTEGHREKLRTNMHNGKPMTGSLPTTVRNELAYMEKAIKQGKNKIKYGKIGAAKATTSARQAATQQAQSQTTEQAPTQTAEQPAPQATPVAEDAPVAGAVEQEPQTTEDQQSTEAEQATQGTTTPEVQEESDPLTEALTEEFKKIDQDPKLVKSVVDEVMVLRSEGVTFDQALKSLETQYGKNTMDAVGNALERAFPQPRTNTATRITTPDNPNAKIPLQGDMTPTQHLRSFNWVKAFFEPRKTKGGILQKVSNLFSTNIAGSIADYIGRDLSEQEAEVVNQMQQMHPEFVKNFDKVFVVEKGQEPYRYQNPALYLTDFADEQNIRDAVFMGLFNWLATRAGDTVYNKKGKINSMIGQDEKSIPSPAAYSKLSKIGTGMTGVIESLGRDIIKQLHIKGTKDAPHFLESKMENSLGLMALNIMEGMQIDGKPLVTFNTITRGELNNLRNEPRNLKDHEAKEIINLVRINTVKDGDKEALNPIIKGLGTALRDAGRGIANEDRMWTQAFGDLAAKNEPSFDKPFKAPTKVKGSKQKLTKEERDGLQKHLNRRHYIRESIYAFEALGRDAMAAILGNRDPKTVHVVNRDAQENINANIERSLDTLFDFRDRRDVHDSEDGAFYLSHDKWSTGRYGVDADFNPQGDKAHRAFTTQAGWRGTVMVDEMPAMWWRAMDEFLGSDDRDVLITPYGDGSGDNSKKHFGEAIDALKRYLTNFEFEGESDIVTVQEAVIRAGHKAESFNALLEVAKHELALDNGDASFNTDLAIEVDGKTNGVIITEIIYADGDTTEELLANLGKGGIYGENSPYQNFEDFKNDKNNLDAYEEVSDKLVKRIADMFTDSGKPSEALTGIQAIFGMVKVTRDDETDEVGYEPDAKGARNTVKPALMTSNYLAGDATVSGELATVFIKNIYTKLEEISAMGDEKAKAEYALLRKHVNAIQPNALPANGNYLDIKMSDKHVENIRKNVVDAIGAPVADMINTQYAKTKEGQQTVNNMLDLMYRMHKAVRNDLIDKTRKKLVAEGKLDSKIGDLTTKQIQEIDESIEILAPQIKTYFSKPNTSLDYNMKLGKTERVSYETQGNANLRIRAKRINGKERNTSASVRETAAMGKAGGVTTTQNLDATAMWKAYSGDNDVFGVHDAIYVSPLDAEEASEKMNADFGDVVAAMDAPFEVARSYDQAMKKFKQYLSNLDRKDRRIIESDILELIDGGLREPGVDWQTATKGSAEWARRVYDMKVLRERINRVKKPLLAQNNLVIDQYNVGNSLTATVRNPAERKAPTKAEITEALDKVVAPENKVEEQAPTPEPVQQQQMPKQTSRSKKATQPAVQQAQQTQQAQPKGDGPTWSAEDMKKRLASVAKLSSQRDPELAARAQAAIANVTGPVTFSMKAPKPVDIVEAVEGGNAPVTLNLDVSKVAQQPKQAQTGSKGVTLDKNTVWAKLLDHHKELTNNPATTTRLRMRILDAIDILKGDITVPTATPTLEQLLEAVEKSKDNTLGSMADAQTSPTGKDADAVVDSTNILEVFDKLPNSGGKSENTAHKDFLRERVNHFAALLMNPFKLYLSTQKDMPNHGSATDTDMYINNLIEGAPETSGILAMGVRMSPEEVMAHELNHLVYVEGLRKESKEKNYLQRMFLAARQQLTFRDLVADDASQSELEGAEKTFNYIFNNLGGNHLAEFAAFATTNEQFMRALGKVKMKPNKVFEGSIAQIMRNIIDNITEVLSGRVLKLRGLSADQKIVKLLDNMHRVSIKKRKNIIADAEALHHAAQEAVAKPVKYLGEQIRKALANMADSKNPFIGVAAETAIHLGESKEFREKQIEYAREIYHGIRDKVVGTHDNFLTQTFTEIIGRTSSNAAARDLDRSSNVRLDRTRKQAKEATTQYIKDSFGRPLTEKEWEATNKILVKLDLSSLAHLGAKAIREVLLNPNSLSRLINGLERELELDPNYNFYIRAAKNLGYYMNSGKSREAVGLLNAYNIARVAGYNKVKVSDAHVAKVEPAIDMLATLYAIQEAEEYGPYLDTLRAVVEEEFARDPENNGITAMVNTQDVLKREAASTQFTSAEQAKALMIKGWSKETYRAGVDFKVSVAGDRELLAQGYVMEKSPLPNDPADPNQEVRHLYTAPDGALAPYVTGIVSMTSNIAKGSSLADIRSATGKEVTPSLLRDDLMKVNSKREADYQKMIDSPNGPIGAPEENYMIPLINEKGDIQDWRYMMSESQRDGHLQKDNHGANVLGAMAGNVVDKKVTKEVNREAAELLHETWEKEKGTRRAAYIKIHAEAPNARHREIWNMIPNDMKAHAKELFGGDYMMVRADQVTQFYGYRKFSMGQLFHKDPATRNLWEKLAIGPLEAILGGNTKAAHRILKAENFLQALTQEVKDLVIVKSGIVTLANMASNSMLLVMNGLNPIEAMRLQYKGFKYGSQLTKDIHDVRQLRLKANTTYGNETDLRNIQGEIARLTRRIQENPTFEAYQAGLMPTIVEDQATDLEFSGTMRGDFQKGVSKFIDNKLSFAPSWARDVTKFVAGSPDSKIYQFMNNMVMQSDFISRYSMLEHWKAEKGINAIDNPTEFNNLVGEAEELFVNFNAPTHKGIQYLNDIGLAWFTKYVLRVNRSIARTFVKNPIKASLAVIGVDMSFLDPLVDNPAASSVLGGGDPTRVFSDPLSQAIRAMDLAVGAQIVGAIV